MHRTDSTLESLRFQLQSPGQRPRGPISYQRGPKAISYQPDRLGGRDLRPAEPEREHE